MRDITKLQSELLLWKSRWGKLWLGVRVAWGGEAGDPVSQVNGELRYGVHLCWAGWVRELSKGTMAPARTSVLRESCPDPCCPRSEVSQFSSSLYVSGTLCAAALFWIPDGVRV